MSNSAFTVVGSNQNITFPITVPQGGTGDASFTPYAVVTGGTTSTNPLQQVSGLGTNGQVLTSQGPGALPTWTTISTTGFVVNRVSNYNYSTATLTNGLPQFTVPQNTDGTQILSQTITPTSASHVLVIEAYMLFSCTITAAAAFFQDSTVNALYAQLSSVTSSTRDLYMKLITTAGTTSATTFKVRLGPVTTGFQVLLNQTTSNIVYFGGLTSLGPWIQITEYTS